MPRGATDGPRLFGAEAGGDAGTEMTDPGDTRAASSGTAAVAASIVASHTSASTGTPGSTGGRSVGGGARSSGGGAGSLVGVLASPGRVPAPDSAPGRPPRPSPFPPLPRVVGRTVVPGFAADAARIRAVVAIIRAVVAVISARRLGAGIGDGYRAAGTGQHQRTGDRKRRQTTSDQATISDQQRWPATPQRTETCCARAPAGLRQKIAKLLRPLDVPRDKPA